MGVLSADERHTLADALAGGALTRAQVLRAVAEDQPLKDAEFRRAFVLMQYFGYLRRSRRNHTACETASNKFARYIPT